MENLTPGEEEEILTPNPEEDPIDEDELDQELADLDGDELKDEDDNQLLEYIRKQTGKTFKSKEDVIKSLKQMDKLFAEGKAQKKTPEPVTPQPVVDSSMSERLLRLEQPDSQHVIDMIKRDHPGKDPYVVWNESEFYRNEASVRAAKQEAEKRMQPPSGEPGGKQKTEEEVIADKWMNRPLPPGFAK